MRFKFIATALVCGLLMTTLNACKEEPKPKVQEPVKILFNPTTAYDKITKRIAAIDIDASPLTSNTDYINLIANHETAGSSVTGFISDIASDDTKSVVVLAHVQNGDNLKFPPIPLFIFEKEAADWKTTFQAKGPLTPYFVARRAPLSVNMEMVLLKEIMDDLATDAGKLIQSYHTKHALYSNERADAIAALADDFSQRIALVEEANLKDIAQFNISYLESFGSAINLLGKTGETNLTSILSVEGKTSVLPLHHNVPDAYNDLLTFKIGDQSARMALGDLESGFWSVPSEALASTCQAIQGALQERLGLSARDSAMVLWRMLQPHALFAQNVDYIAQCTGEDIAALLTEAGFSLPAAKTGRAGRTAQNAMNKTLSKIATLLKNTKDSNQQRMTTLMDSTVVVRDQARLLFSANPDQLIDSTEDVVAPTLSGEEAAEYMMMLPVQAYGCYSRGQGQVGNHRATLLKMENDPTLWLLNLAFNEENKIAGIQLKGASQRDFCRAIGGRKGNNRCAFSGKRFPGLQPDRCG
ncbi:hypothetical protein RYZ26_05010 [Terasakiella sp. A23]|uniref:hypothetical protein n=1 Tax=Terasakiella sp. FCG-A23 TaxID=3080561 RepID=UPI0029541A08|nr:hypothetical protein [Terasakiella sp. A23]MDV7338939.1 hypothetical protein [Terasakiella sp. A23]